MDDDPGRPKPILPTVILILVGGFLIAAAVITRDSIGNFTSWIMIITAIVITLAISALWRRHRNQQSH